MEVRAHDWVEVRRAEFDKPGLKPRFDELIAKGVDVHIEQIDNSTYWMAIERNGERQVVVFSAINGRAHIAARTEAD